MTELKRALPEGYKMTELGMLPEEWEVVRLGDVIEELKEKNKSNVDLKVFTVSNMEGFVPSDRFFSKRVYSKDTDNYKIVRQGYFAYNPYRINVGSIGLFKEIIGLVSPAYVVFKVKRTDCLHPEFLFRLLKSPFYMSEIQRIAMSRGSVRRSLSYRDLSDFKIPLPPLPEQKKIAAILSTVQEAKEKTEAVISAARDLKKSMMSYLFTYGPVPLPEAERVPRKETELGMVPEEWEVVRLGEVADVNYGKANPKDNGNIPVVGSGGVYSGTKTPLVDYPTIVIGRKGTAGKAWLFLEPCYPSDTTFYLSWKQEVDIRFLFNYMVINPLSGEHAKTTLPSLQKPDLENYLIPLPPLPEQEKIASILSAIDEKIEAEENKKKALEDLFNTLLHNLMAAKIRVNNLDLDKVELAM